MNTEMQILIVDDYASIRKIVKGVLHKLGYDNVTEANDSVLTGQYCGFRAGCCWVVDLFGAAVATSCG